MSCAACGALPARLVVNTGRDESMPPEGRALESMNLSRERDLRRCRDCRALFVWGDHPQFYGSGNLDEETLDRLTPEESATVELLLAGGLGPEVNTLVNAAFAQLEGDVVMLLVGRLHSTRPDQYARLIPLFVERLVRTADLGLFHLLESFAARDRRCAGEVVELLRLRAPLQGLAKELAARCEARRR